jgi:integrin beta 3
MSITSSPLLPDARSFGEQLAQRIQAAIRPLLRRLEQIEQQPLARDGRDGQPGVPGAPGAPGESGRDGLDGARGQDGRDGTDGAPGVDGRDGQPGVPGAPGAPGAPGENGRDGRDGLDGAAGVDGRDGQDGFGLEQLDLDVIGGGRTILATFTSGERQLRREARTAMMLYRGVFQAGAVYEPGDMVTWAGSLWHCNAETTDRPGEGGATWTLAVKKGRDGKDGAVGAKGEVGPAGRNGRDLTQLGPDGARH